MSRSAAGANERTMVWLLGITQIVGYGTLYYSFAILANDIASSMGQSRAVVFAVFSLSLVAGGIVSPFTGRMLDRFGATTLMWMGSLLAAAALAVSALVSNIILFGLAFIVMQVASAVILYDAAFVALVQVAGAKGQLRIVQLTLIAGFASTLFWPLTTWLDAHLGWRNVFLLYAAMNVLICAPLHYHLRKWSGGGETPVQKARAETAVPVHQLLPPPLQPRAFMLVTMGFALTGFTISATLAQLVPMLQELGVGETSMYVGALFGPSQVIIRFLSLVIGNQKHPVVATIIASLLQLSAILALVFTAPSIAGAVAFSVCLGCCSGLHSIVKGTLPLALFGSGGFGQRLGNMALFRLILAALAPFIFAWLMQHAGATAALLVLAGFSLLGLVAFLQIVRMQASARGTQHAT